MVLRDTVLASNLRASTITTATPPRVRAPASDTLRARGRQRLRERCTHPGSHRSAATARLVLPPCRVCFSQAALQGRQRSSGRRDGGGTASHACGERMLNGGNATEARNPRACRRVVSLGNAEATSGGERRAAEAASAKPAAGAEKLSPTAAADTERRVAQTPTRRGVIAHSLSKPDITGRLRQPRCTGSRSTACAQCVCECLLLALHGSATR
jgi:hypothetical protein